jgi:hypothetical protein
VRVENDIDRANFARELFFDFDGAEVGENLSTPFFGELIMNFAGHVGRY